MRPEDVKNPRPDEWLDKYIQDWFFWNGVAFILVGIIGIATCIYAIISKYLTTGTL